MPIVGFLVLGIGPPRGLCLDKSTGKGELEPTILAVYPFKATHFRCCSIWTRTGILQPF